MTIRVNQDNQLLDFRGEKITVRLHDNVNACVE